MKIGTLKTIKRILDIISIASFPYAILWFAIRAFKNQINWLSGLLTIIAFVAWLIFAGHVMKQNDDHGRNN